MKKYKILFILHLPPPIHGASIMGKYIHDSRLINESFDCRFINLSASTDVSEIGKLSLAKIWFLIKSYFEIIITVSKFKPDLCYITPSSWDWGFYRDFIVIQSLKQLKIPIVAHFHNKAKQQWIEKNFNKFINRIFYKKLRIILLTEELYLEKSPFIALNDVYFCPNGVEKIEIPKNYLKNKSEKFCFLFLSNMIEEKGIYVLLDACKILKQSHHNFECHFIGKWADVSESDYNRYVKEKKLENFVFAHGPKYDSEKNHYFLNADVFVFPTYYQGETFGLVLLEAMQFSLPCISTFEGGIPSVIVDGETGFLVKTKDTFDLASKMEFMIQHPDLAKRMGEKGKMRFEENFTLEKFEQRFMKIMAEILNNE